MWPTVAGQQTPATALLSKLGIAHSVHAYEHDPRRGSYGLEASEVLGVAPERVFKTLVAEVDGALTVGVVPWPASSTSRRRPRPSGRPATWPAGYRRWATASGSRS